MQKNTLKLMKDVKAKETKKKVELALKGVDVQLKGVLKNFPKNVPTLLREIKAAKSQLSKDSKNTGPSGPKGEKKEIDAVVKQLSSMEAALKPLADGKGKKLLKIKT